MHELFFDTLEQAQQAMASEEGRQAGRVLQALSLGHMVLFLQIIWKTTSKILKG